MTLSGNDLPQNTETARLDGVKGFSLERPRLHEARWMWAHYYSLVPRLFGVAELHALPVRYALRSDRGIGQFFLWKTGGQANLG